MTRTLAAARARACVCIHGSQAAQRVRDSVRAASRREARVELQMERVANCDPERRDAPSPQDLEHFERHPNSLLCAIYEFCNARGLLGVGSHEQLPGDERSRESIAARLRDQAVTPEDKVFLAEAYATNAAHDATLVVCGACGRRGFDESRVRFPGGKPRACFSRCIPVAELHDMFGMRERRVNESTGAITVRVRAKARAVFIQELCSFPAPPPRACPPSLRSRLPSCHPVLVVSRRWIFTTTHAPPLVQVDELNALGNVKIPYIDAGGALALGPEVPLSLARSWFKEEGPDGRYFHLHPDVIVWLPAEEEAGGGDDTSGGAGAADSAGGGDGRTAADAPMLEIITAEEAPIEIEAVALSVDETGAGGGGGGGGGDDVLAEGDEGARSRPLSSIICGECDPCEMLWTSEVLPSGGAAATAGGRASGAVPSSSPIVAPEVVTVSRAAGGGVGGGGGGVGGGGGGGGGGGPILTAVVPLVAVSAEEVMVAEAVSAAAAAAAEPRRLQPFARLCEACEKGLKTGTVPPRSLRAGIDLGRLIVGLGLPRLSVMEKVILGGGRLYRCIFKASTVGLSGSWRMRGHFIAFPHTGTANLTPILESADMLQALQERVLVYLVGPRGRMNAMDRKLRSQYRDLAVRACVLAPSLRHARTQSTRSLEAQRTKSTHAPMHTLPPFSLSRLVSTRRSRALRRRHHTHAGEAMGDLRLVPGAEAARIQVGTRPRIRSTRSRLRWGERRQRAARQRRQDLQTAGARQGAQRELRHQRHGGEIGARRTGECAWGRPPCCC